MRSPRHRYPWWGILAGLLVSAVVPLLVPLAAGAGGGVPTPARSPVATSGAPDGAERGDRSDDGCTVAPVDAPVVDGFRLPAQRWGAGNRGWEYRTRPGQPVVAVAPGTVTFAGKVATTLHVTVDHPDGLRTSYSFLADVTVHQGDRVTRGQVVGHTGDTFHLGLRRGRQYRDPAELFVRACRSGRARLVPLDGGSSEP